MAGGGPQPGLAVHPPPNPAGDVVALWGPGTKVVFVVFDPSGGGQQGCGLAPWGTMQSSEQDGNSGYGGRVEVGTGV